jgi:flagellar assembly protein FliH
LSRNVIKRHEFAHVCLLPEGGGGLPSLASEGTRVRDLVVLLERAEEDARRRVDEARAEGRRAARDEFVREFGEALATLRAAAAALEDARAREGERTLQEIVHLAVAVAGKIVRREVHRDDAYTVRLVRRCLRRIPFPAPVRVRLHVADLAAVTAARDSLLGEGAGHQLSFEEDARVERGGCVVETPDFVVDGRPKVQLGAAQEALAGDA